MSYTYTTNVGDGVQKDFPFSFAGQDTGYIAPSNIAVYIAGVATSNYSISPRSPNVVSFLTPPPVGAEVLIRRIMPKNVPFADFSRGNPFNQDTLNNTNLQMLYLIQEIYDGYLPQGFFFRVDIDMRGHKFLNLGPGVNDGDSVNMGQLKKEIARNDTQDGRLTALEDNIVAGEQANFFAQLYVATGGETQISTTNGLFCAALYIQGLYQHKIAGAYSQIGGAIIFPEPLRAGWEVYLILGTDLPSDSIYATIESVAALQAVVDGINSTYAKKGANDDITSLSGLTTPLTREQGGTGNVDGSATKLTTPRNLQVNLASSTSASFDGSSDVTPGVTGVLPVVNGGTGNSVNRAATSTKLDVPRGIRTNLASTNAVNFDGSSDVTPGVTGTLEIGNGGTGATTVASAQTNLDIFPTTGKVDGSNAAAGKVGEFLTVSATGIALTNNGANNVVQLALTPGDWDVQGIINYGPQGSTSISVLAHGLSSVSANFPAYANGNQLRMNFPTGTQQVMNTPLVRFSVSVATTVYLVSVPTFASGTLSADATIRARRVR